MEKYGLGPNGAFMKASDMLLELFKQDIAEQNFRKENT